MSEIRRRDFLTGAGAFAAGVTAALTATRRAEAGDPSFMNNFPDPMLECLGNEPCHFVLIFDNGYFSEFGTFSVTDWMGHTPKRLLAKNFGLPESIFADFPREEVYFAKGAIPPESPPANLGPAPRSPLTHKWQLLKNDPLVNNKGGTLWMVDSIRFPISRTITGAVLELEPGALRELHWHPTADEWQYVLQGQMSMTMFGSHIRTSAKRGLRLRRITCKADGSAFTVRPAFVLPYLTGWTEDVAHPLFLRRFGVPFWALAHVFGRDPMYWYRLDVGLGRHSLVGTTVRQAEIPADLLADEHHQGRDGVKNYIATTVGDGCCLGASLAPTAGAKDLQAAYGVFVPEALNVQAHYRPRTVNADGWAATRQAWRALFPLVVILRCFLHGWLSIRARAKHLGGLFATLAEKVWDAYGAPDRRSFAQRLRRLGEWAGQHVQPAVVLEQVQKLCGRSREYGVAYAHPGGHRTSNMLDRVMRLMHRYFEAGQHLHGSEGAAEQHCRAWALLHNFTPWRPAPRRVNGGYRSPAERLNQYRYHDNWLQNLLVSASLAGYRR